MNLNSFLICPPLGKTSASHSFFSLLHSLMKTSTSWRYSLAGRTVQSQREASLLESVPSLSLPYTHCVFFRRPTSASKFSSVTTMWRLYATTTTRSISALHTRCCFNIRTLSKWLPWSVGTY